MSSLEELIAKARKLHSEGHNPSQIADELNLSMETVTWLLTQQKGAEAPRDVAINWTPVSSHADMLRDIAVLMLKQFFYAQLEDRSGREAAEPTVAIGIAQSGIPLATLIAAERDIRLAIYHPRKHASGENPVGSLSGNFAQIAGERCLIVDDVITSGRTMKETVEYLRSHGAQPVAISVLFDKRSIKEVDGVPLHSLFRVSRID
jgi:orotate phosphoribosyltransferase